MAALDLYILVAHLLIAVLGGYLVAVSYSAYRAERTDYLLFVTVGLLLMLLGVLTPEGASLLGAAPDVGRGVGATGVLAGVAVMLWAIR